MSDATIVHLYILVPQMHKIISPFDAIFLVQTKNKYSYSYIISSGFFQTISIICMLIRRNESMATGGDPSVKSNKLASSCYLIADIN